MRENEGKKQQGVKKPHSHVEKKSSYATGQENDQEKYWLNPQYPSS